MIWRGGYAKRPKIERGMIFVGITKLTGQSNAGCLLVEWEAVKTSRKLPSVRSWSQNTSATFSVPSISRHSPTGNVQIGSRPSFLRIVARFRRLSMSEETTTICDSKFMSIFQACEDGNDFWQE
jgi:hypothetical protein